LESSLPHPYQRALIPLTGLAAFAFLASLALAIFNFRGLFWIGFVFFVVFGLLDLTIWLLGQLQVRRAKAFLDSDRPLIRWTYSAAEWQQVKENIWQEESADWKVQWGCLTILLALAGALTGGMLGIEDGILQLGLGAFLGFGVGALIGVLIGGIVAGSNHWAARLAYRNPKPGQVALGPNEIYVSGDYFRGDDVNRYIGEATIHRGQPTTLEFQLVFPPRPRREPEETWSIPVPTHFLEKVEETLASICDSQNGGAS